MPAERSMPPAMMITVMPSAATNTVADGAAIGPRVARGEELTCGAVHPAIGDARRRR